MVNTGVSEYRDGGGEVTNSSSGEYSPLVEEDKFVLVETH